MGRTILTSLLVALAVAAGSVDAVETASRAGGLRPGWRCQPVLPILDASVNAVVSGNAVESCRVIDNPRQWMMYCAEHGLVCDPYDEAFFDHWTIVAVVIETMSPRSCENSGPVPGWRVGCLSLRGSVVLARVAMTEAGVECTCTMNPQWPVRRHLVQAIPSVDAIACRAMQENHLIECLPGR
jgi:hypothetical protein